MTKSANNSSPIASDTVNDARVVKLPACLLSLPDALPLPLGDADALPLPIGEEDALPLAR